MNKFTRVLVLIPALGGLPAGCSSLSNTEKGAGLGGLIGAGLGTAVGAATHNPKTGAVVGGLLGAGVGGIAGSQADEREKQMNAEVQVAQAQASAAQAANGRLGMIDVCQMVQQGQSSAIIINQIRNTNSTFQLSTSDLQYLKANNVPDDVIGVMQNARPQPTVIAPARPQRVYVESPPPVVVYERPYYPPPGMVVYGRGRW